MSPVLSRQQSPDSDGEAAAAACEPVGSHAPTPHCLFESEDSWVYGSRAVMPAYRGSLKVSRGAGLAMGMLAAAAGGVPQAAVGGVLPAAVGDVLSAATVDGELSATVHDVLSTEAVSSGEHSAPVNGALQTAAVSDALASAV
ncbi:unnamed protein product [Boreogadus saida]